MEDMVTDNQMSNMLTVREVASVLHVHPNTLRRWSDAGTIRSTASPPGVTEDSCDRMLPASLPNLMPTKATAAKEVQFCDKLDWMVVTASRMICCLIAMCQAA